MIKKLAKVTKAKLEIKERGILNFWIFVDYEDGLSQGIGGICLDSFDKEKKKRIGTAYGCEMIRQLLKVFDVDDFSEMKDKIIYVLGEGEGFEFNYKGFESLRICGNHGKIIFDDILKEFSDEKDKTNE